MPVIELRSGRPGLIVNFKQAALEELSMDLLWTIAVILIILWLLGMVSSFTLGGFVHILLVLAIIVVLIRVIQGRRPV
jgi:Family of unknown function (DUF5670)